MWTKRHDRVQKARTVLAPQLGPWELGKAPKDRMPSVLAVQHYSAEGQAPVHKCERCEKAVACGRFALTSQRWDKDMEEMVDVLSYKQLCGGCGFAIGADRRQVLMEDEAGREYFIYPLRYKKVERAG